MTREGDNVRTTTRIVPHEFDAEAEAFARLPESIRRFLNNDAPVPIAPSQVEAFLKQYGEATTLYALRQQVRGDTQKIYGGAHPQAKEK